MPAEKGVGRVDNFDFGEFSIGWVVERGIKLIYLLPISTMIGC